MLICLYHLKCTYQVPETVSWAFSIMHTAEDSVSHVETSQRVLHLTGTRNTFVGRCCWGMLTSCSKSCLH